MSTTCSVEQGRTQKEVIELYTSAVEADEDDDDCISPQAFIDECYAGAVGIGIHPKRRHELIHARNLRNGDQ